MAWLASVMSSQERLECGSTSRKRNMQQGTYPHSRDSAHVIHKIIRKYRTRVIIYTKLSVINCVHMTAFSNTSQDFREHARSFRNVPGLSITYQVFGAHIHILGTPLTSSIKIIRKYRTRVIIYSKLSVINCVHMTAFSNTSQFFREHARSFRNVGPTRSFDHIPCRSLGHKSTF